MFNNYLYSRSGEGANTKSPGAIFVIGRVKSVVLGEFTTDGKKDPEYRSPRDVGKITFEMMYTNMNLSKASQMTEPAYPMFMNIKQYPLVSELVLIVPGPVANLNDDINNRSYYYFPPYSVWNNVQHGAFPNLDEYAGYISDQMVQTQYQSVSDKSKFPALPVGKTFEEKRDIRKLQPFEGDTIIESRFGQSIRFGSTVVGTKTLNTWSSYGYNGSPITIIRNGQGRQETKDYFKTLVEDVNEDQSSIWLTTDQTIVFKDIADFPMASYYGSTVPKADVTQLFRRITSNETISAQDTDLSIIVPGTNEETFRNSV